MAWYVLHVLKYIKNSHHFTMTSGPQDRPDT